MIYERNRAGFNFGLILVGDFNALLVDVGIAQYTGIGQEAFLGESCELLSLSRRNGQNLLPNFKSRAHLATPNPARTARETTADAREKPRCRWNLPGPRREEVEWQALPAGRRHPALSHSH